MRLVVPIFLSLAACSQQAASPPLKPGTFAGEGRDRLCIAGEAANYRGGLIAYGQGNTNCSANGRIEAQGDQLVLIPRGETACRIPLAINGNTIAIGEPPAACSYYCGPGVIMAGKSFNRSDMGAEAVDLAGDPLC